MKSGSCFFSGNNAGATVDEFIMSAPPETPDVDSFVENKTWTIVCEKLKVFVILQTKWRTSFFSVDGPKGPHISIKVSQKHEKFNSL